MEGAVGVSCGGAAIRGASWPCKALHPLQAPGARHWPALHARPALPRPLATPHSLLFRAPQVPQGPWQQYPTHRHVRPCQASNTSGDSEASSSDDDPPAAPMDWREFRARLIAQDAKAAGEGSLWGSAEEELESRRGPLAGGSWAHPIVQPEAGALLVAKPAWFSTTQTYFNQAVIFLLHHSAEGSVGLILNKPTVVTLGSVPAFEELCPELGPSPLYLGGDVGTSCTHVLHGVPDLEESSQVVDGIFTGGFNSIREHVKSGRSQHTDYRWFTRYSGWGPGQLEGEVAAGVWVLASCSKDLILKHTVGLKKPLWEEVLVLMGGEYEDYVRQAKRE